MPEVDPQKGDSCDRNAEGLPAYFLPVITRLHLSPIEKESLWKTQFLGNGEILREMSCRDMEKKTPESRKCGNAEMRKCEDDLSMRNQKKLFLGLDFGTDSVRVLAVSESGEKEAFSERSYSRWTDRLYCDAANLCFRQHPLDYLESMEQAVLDVLRDCDADRVAGIGVDTTGSTPCALDGQGRPLALHPAFSEDPDAMFLLWKDHSSVREAAEITSHAKTWGGVDYTAYSGGVYSPEWFWSKILHALRGNSSVRGAAVSWGEHCDWMVAELAGTPVIRPGRCAAGHKAMWHASWGGLPSEEFLAGVDPLLKGLRGRLYSETFTADLPVGRLSGKWMERFHLKQQAPVVAGGVIDCHAGAVGAGVKAFQLLKVLGTSTCDIVVVPHLDHCVRGICGQVDGSVLPGMTALEAGQSAFGDIYAWFRNFLSYGGGDVSIARLSAEAERIAPGASPCLALDWMNGRRTPDLNPELKGALFGLTLATEPPAVFRALAESTVYGARKIAERLTEEGVPVHEIVALGGIARKSPFVMQLCADVMNRDIQIVREDQACALGAAVLAAASSGSFPSVESAMDAMSSDVETVYHPDPERVALYERLYRKYLACAGAVERLENTEDFLCSRQAETGTWKEKST